MTNILLNIYEFQAPWAKPVLGSILKPEHRVTILTMSHGNEVPDRAAWEDMYLPGQPVYNALTAAYGAYGIPAENIQFVSWYHDTPETALEKIGEADVLFLTGGLPDVFYERLE